MDLSRQYKLHSLKTPYQISSMEGLTRALYALFRFLEPYVVPGSCGRVLENASRYFAKKGNFTLALKGFSGFPASICVSVCPRIAHGIPDKKPFVDGDIVIVDVVLSQGEWHADASWTWLVGRQDPEAVEFLQKALRVSLVAARAAGQGLRAISHAVQAELDDTLHIAPGFTGHGIGRSIHELPQIPLVQIRGQTNPNDSEFSTGTVFTIEPVVLDDRPNKVFLQNDGSYCAPEGTRAAQFEFMVAIEAEGPRILGISTEDLGILSSKLRFAALR